MKTTNAVAQLNGIEKQEAALARRKGILAKVAEIEKAKAALEEQMREVLKGSGVKLEVHTSSRAPRVFPRGFVTLAIAQALKSHKKGATPMEVANEIVKSYPEDIKGIEAAELLRIVRNTLNTSDKFATVNRGIYKVAAGASFDGKLFERIGKELAAA